MAQFSKVNSRYGAPMGRRNTGHAPIDGPLRTSKMITFHNGLDIRTRQQSAPTVARFHVGAGVYRFVVIGTEYGHIHTTGGDVRTWGSYSGARRFARSYSPF